MKRITTWKLTTAMAVTTAAFTLSGCSDESATSTDMAAGSSASDTQLSGGGSADGSKGVMESMLDMTDMLPVVVPATIPDGEWTLSSVTQENRAIDGDNVSRRLVFENAAGEWVQVCLQDETSTVDSCSSLTMETQSNSLGQIAVYSFSDNFSGDREEWASLPLVDEWTAAAWVS